MIWAKDFDSLLCFLYSTNLWRKTCAARSRTRATWNHAFCYVRIRKRWRKYRKSTWFILSIIGKAKGLTCLVPAGLFEVSTLTHHLHFKRPMR